MTADPAVQIALLNNRGLQAAYNELGIAEAVSVRQSLPPNPSVSISRVTGSVETEIDRQIVGNILALATLPARTGRLPPTVSTSAAGAALETLRAAAETRRAFYRAVAARELAGFLHASAVVRRDGSQLAKRLGETGAMNKLDQAREQVFYADITAQLARAPAASSASANDSSADGAVGRRS